MSTTDIQLSVVFGGQYSFEKLQSDYEQTDTLARNYIKNKPDLVNFKAETVAAETVVFDENPTGAIGARKLQYSPDEKTLEFGLADGGRLQIGKEMFEEYTNIDTVPLTNGMIVSTAAIPGNQKGIKRTDFTSLTSIRSIVGMVTVGSIATNQAGRVTTKGIINDLNTNGWAKGSQLWGNPAVLGGWSGNKPAKPQYAVQIGQVVVASATVGSVELNVAKDVKFSDLADVNGSTNLIDDTDTIPKRDADGIIREITVADIKADFKTDTDALYEPLLGFTPENTANKGQANGYASLGADGLVPSTQLPSFVDDVLEFANLAAFPVTGETGKIYVALDTNKTYRWSGSVYIYITSGAVDSVAGKTGVVTLVKADVGLGNVDNTSDVNKPVSTLQAAAIATKVGLTGDETVAGVKTFSSSPIVPNPTTSGQALNKSTADGTYVALTGAQNVAGVKTFTDSPVVPTPVNNTDAANKSYVDTIAVTQSNLESVRSQSTTKAPTSKLVDDNLLNIEANLMYNHGYFYQAEYIAILNQMTEQPTHGFSEVYNSFIKGLKDDGIWAGLDFLSIKAMPTNAGGEALINWKNPSWNKMTLHGAANPTFIPYKGFKGTASGYINTKFNPSSASNFSINDASVFLYLADKGVTQCGYTFGILDTNGVVGASVYCPVLNLKGFRLNSIETINDTVVPPTYEGLWLLNRTSPTGFSIIKDGTTLLTKVTNSTGVPNLEMKEFAIDSNGSVGTFSNGTHSIFGAGKGLTESKIAALNIRISTFINVMNNVSQQLLTVAWNNSIIRESAAGFNKRNTFSEISFYHKGGFYLKANPTVAVVYPQDAYVSVYVNDEFYTKVFFTDWEYKKVDLPYVTQKITLVQTMEKIYTSEQVIYGCYVTDIASTETITPIDQGLVTEKILFLGDSITSGGSADNREEEAYGRLFTKENGKTTAFLSVGAWKLSEIAGDASKIITTVADIQDLLSNATSKKLSIMIGVNDWGFNSLPASTYGTYYANLLDAINLADNTIEIFCISPLPVADDNQLLKDYRTALETVCSTRSYTTYINGFNLIDPTTDLVDWGHPSTAGHKKIKDGIYPIICPE